MRQDLTKVASTYRQEWFKAEPDILVVIPEPEYRDTPGAARANSDMMQTLARDLGPPCGIVVVMSHHLSQDAEAREVYSEGLIPELFYGCALVVENPLARAISSFYLGLTKPDVPVKLVGSIEEGIRWLEGLRRA